MCNAILGQYENGQPIRCDENPDPARECLHVHLWARDKVTGAFRGDYHYLGLYKTAEEKAEHERKVADRAKADAIRHPHIEWVPMSDVAFNRPPDPPKSAEQVATETKQTRLGALRKSAWTKLTLKDQQEATDLAFALGETVPPITALV